MGTAERRQREAEKRRGDILSAARKVFFEHGFEGATMPQIAAEAELAPGTLYLYFQGKEALYVELIMEGYDLLIPRLEAAAKAEGGPEAVGSALVDAFFGFAREYPAYFDILFFIIHRENSGTLATRFPQEQVRRLDRRQAACEQVVSGILDQIRPDASENREILVSAIWSMLAGVVFYFRSRDSFDAVAQEAKALLLHALFRE